MARMARLDAAGITQHIVQRGNDRQACFFGDVDYARYLQDLREASFRFGCQIHAYVLMTNHVHLLATPRHAGSTGRMMQAVGRRYVRYVNDRLGRTGTLWEGRYKSCLVDAEHYVLACYRYIELNPVRAGMVLDRAAYRWSSFARNALGKHDALVVPHPIYQRIAHESSRRQQEYRKLVLQGISAEELDALRLYTQRQKALGSDRFQEQIERLLGRRVALGKPGRPRKQAAEKVP